jgi:diaminopimelate epimerase
MRFRKYQGIGNDFVMIEDADGRLGRPGSLDPSFVARLCDRHTGIGADGVIRSMREADGALRMDYYNADGGPAEMCGNGIRCLAVLEHKAGRLDPGSHPVVTGAGVLTVDLHHDGIHVSVDMGEPELDASPKVVGGQEGLRVSMGNPHFVIFVDEPTDELVLGIGPRLEVNEAFPNRTNVEFVTVLSEDEIHMRVWERGSGETLACGTGACAAAVASAALGRTKREITAHLPGGSLGIRWTEDGHVWMTGPAEEVFTGEIDA